MLARPETNQTALRVLVIRQPWASFIVHGHKNIENRSWATRYRGPVLVQASARLPSRSELDSIFGEFGPSDLPLELGGIVGRVDIVDCVTEHASKWFEGPQGFVLANARRLPFLARKGTLGLVEASADLRKWAERN